MVAKLLKITWNMVCSMDNEEAQISEYAYNIVDDELDMVETEEFIQYG